MTVFDPTSPPSYSKVAGALPSADADDSSQCSERASIVSSIYDDLLSSKNWFVLSKQWWDGFVTGDSEAPVDNSDILDDAGKFKSDAEEQIDFVLIPERAFDWLVRRFGIVDNSHRICRRVVENDGKTFVELRPYSLRVNAIGANKEILLKTDHAVELSRLKTIEFFYKLIHAQLRPKTPLCRFPGSLKTQPQPPGRPLPRVYAESNDELYERPIYCLISDKPDGLLQDALASGTRVLIDIPNESGVYNIPDEQIERDGVVGKKSDEPSATAATRFGGETSGSRTKCSASVIIPAAPIMPAPPAASSPVKLFGNSPTPLPTLKLSSNNFGGGGFGDSEEEHPPRHTPGLCGLSNLGNTCFMNSGLQCLSNVRPLRDYFLSKRYEEEINTDNVLGTGGRLAHAFALMLQHMWSGREDVFVPREVKYIMGQIHEDFSGYRQHDSQELLAILLDRLHEDLNRVKVRKPISLNSDDELKENSIEEVAKKFWDAHLQMNDSEVVDLLQGQLKSTLTCPSCEKISITFDPFQFLSVPLPQRENYRDCSVVLIPPEVNLKWAQVDVRYKSERFTSVSRLKEALQDKIALPSNENLCLLHYQATANKVTIQRDTASIEKMAGDSNFEYSGYFAYRMPELKQSADDDTNLVTVIATQLVRSGSVSHKYRAVGWPMVYRTDEASLNYDSIHTALKRIISIQFADFDGVDEWRAARQKEIEEERAQPVPADPQPRAEAAAASSSSSSSKMETDEPEQDVELLQDDDEEEGEGASEEEPQLFELLKRSPVYSSYISSVNFEPVPGKGGSARDWFNTTDRIPGVDDRIAYVGVLWDSSAYEKFFRSDLNQTLVPFAPPQSAADNDDKQQDEFEEMLNSNRPLQVSDCLKLFLREEKLSSNDTWYCGKCKQHVQAAKKFDIVRLPPILLLHLKRFSNGSFYREKIDVPVDYPIEGLNMSPFIIGDNSTRTQSTADQQTDETSGDGQAIYDLIGQVNHMGGMGGGHYTASCFNDLTRRWHYYDDSRVSSLDASSVQSTAAYVLCYCRRGSQTRTAPAVEPNIEMELSD